ncbi:MAG TPA: CRISPR-associated endonuclease Cas2 [Candidatus Bathyarchaeia archaeon]|nr:CRISPR-associated endonuclease Cas2 [Candidatus Bathyarchaeia archaeon]
MSEDKNKQIARSILKGVLWSGMFVVACGSPNFVPVILPQIAKSISYKIKKRKNEKWRDKKLSNAFYYLKRRRLLEVQKKRGQVYIFLTKEGKKLAGKYQINDLEIEKPKKWDKLWRILVFDVKEDHRIKREALRGKINQLGFYQLQKSVWVCPYNFHKEMELLREFFGFGRDEMKIITAYEIENDKDIRKHFGLK